MSIKTAKRPKGGGVEGGGGSGMSKKHRNSLLFGTWLDWGCGLQDMYILPWVISALEGSLPLQKPMLFHRFSMVPGNAPGRQNPGGALTIPFAFPLAFGQKRRSLFLSLFLGPSPLAFPRAFSWIGVSLPHAFSPLLTGAPSTGIIVFFA